MTLSTDPAFWDPPDVGHSKPADADFWIHHGKQLAGQLNWGPTASPGTTKGRKVTIDLRRNYTLKWKPFSNEPIEHRVFVVEDPG